MHPTFFPRLFYIYFGRKGYFLLRHFPPPHFEYKYWTFFVGGLISATHWAHLTISTPCGSNTALATANEKDKIRQTFPIPTCLSSSSIFPESLQTLQLSLSPFCCDLMKSLTLHKHLLPVLDIPESQVYSWLVRHHRFFASFTLFLPQYLCISCLFLRLLFQFFPYYFYQLPVLAFKPWCLQNFLLFFSTL